MNQFSLIKNGTRLISLKISDRTLKNDLMELQQEALNLGSSLVKIIPAKWVTVDERVRVKCSVPMCSNYNNCAHCPPNTYEVDFIRKVFKKFKWAILLALDVIPVEEFADRSKREASYIWSRKLIDIVTNIERSAFSRGYYFAMGFGQGACLKSLCKQERCLVLKGEKCPYTLTSRPSMEAMSIDVFRLVTRAGWDIYPIYKEVNPEQVPRALSVGIVFIH